MSEAFLLSGFMALSGGFQDAYTYIVRGHVYANAQTGNVVLMSTYLMEGKWHDALRYLLPLLAFALGVFVAENIHHYLEQARVLHWRQIVVLVEIGVMCAVGFMPQRLNLLANMLVSFACAMQVQGFRTVHGYAYASTMCIGNLRSGTSALTHFAQTHDRRELKRARYYFGVILSFAIGAGVGGVLSQRLLERAIWMCVIFLAVAFLLMELDRKKNAVARGA
ncbi:MAG: DUF1275 domain-containing protein [Clostridia bacterium]|nr:DUF1275 domain-containing protein [Clostridia bacterium]